MKNKDEAEFLKRLLATFKVEADDHIKTISSGLLELEKETSPQKKEQVLETIYRQAHSLKGAARAVDLSEVETICQALETLFRDFKYKGVPAAPEIFDILQRSMDTIRRLVNGEEALPLSGVLQDLERARFSHLASQPPTAKTGATQEPPDKPPETVEMPVQKPKPRGGRFKNADETPAKPPSQNNTIRVNSNKLDELLLQAEEMIFMKLSMNRRLAELKETAALFKDLKKKESTTAPLLKSFAKHLEDPRLREQWPRILDYIETIRLRHKQLESTVTRIGKSLQIDHRIFGGMIDNHLQDMRKTLMLPFSTVVESFPLMVRDLSRQKDIQVDLFIKGQDIEIDKRILQEIKDPLIHLIRNAVDHGIETPEIREKAGKPTEGKIELIITQGENNTVEITVRDDGSGIDNQRLKTKAIDTGLYTAEEADRLSVQEVQSLIFHPEFSTSPIITDLSGRGLGLAIVRESVEKLGGHISLESTTGNGATFRILLRMSLATFRGILVEAAGQRFVIPTMHVKKVLQLEPGDIKTVGNRETFKMGDEVMAFARLDQVLGLSGDPLWGKTESPNPMEFNTVVVEAGDRRIGFYVDQILDEEEVLVKELGKQLPRVRNISGASILGSGEVVLILNPVDLVKSAMVTAGQAPSHASGKKDKKTAKKKKAKKQTTKSILVVEDSITSRMLLKNILESSGYRVRVAVDGMDGWLALKEEQFDLAVLDIEMPRLNGLELTEKIRADRQLAQLPVVLVTSLESREDRERGIDVGADGYIVKSSFDQGNLLEVIKRLV